MIWNFRKLEKGDDLLANKRVQFSVYRLKIMWTLISPALTEIELSSLAETSTTEYNQGENYTIRPLEQ